MLRNGAMLAALGVSVSLVIAGAASAGRAEDEDSPLKKLMKKIDAGTKSIREGTTSVAKFKKAGNGKDLAKTAGEIAKVGKETRGFKEPSEKIKKPYDKWVDMNDRFVGAAEELGRLAGKGDFVGPQGLVGPEQHLHQLPWRVPPRGRRRLLTLLPDGSSDGSSAPCCGRRDDRTRRLGHGFLGILAGLLGMFHALPGAAAATAHLERNGTTTGTYFYPWPRDTPRPTGGSWNSTSADHSINSVTLKKA